MTRLVSAFAAVLILGAGACLAAELAPEPTPESSSAPTQPVTPESEGGTPDDASLGEPGDGHLQWPPASQGALPPASPEERRAKLQAELQPPDGQWLIDEDGRAYFIRKHPKSRSFRRVGTDRIRIVYGGEFDIAGEDEKDLWLKIYRVEDLSPVPRPPAVILPTAEELAASAASFVAPLETVDRLQFKAFDSGLPTTGLWRNGFDLADLDGDGKMDLVHGPPRRAGDQLRVFRGDGAGHWTPFRTAVPPGLLDYGDVKVGDLNGDGKLDLAAASHLRGVSAFLGDGAGQFSDWRKGLDFDAPRPGYDGSGFSSRRLELVDWNQDGRLDILALSEGPRITVLNTGTTAKVSGTDIAGQVFGPKLYLNNGDGSWAPVEEAGGPREIFGDDLAVADFNGDRRPDFLTASNGMGKMELLYLQGKKGEDPWSRVTLPLRPRAYVNAVAVADFNGDRKPDFALSYTSFELAVERVGIDVYLASSEGPWQRRPAFSRDGRTGFSALDAGDLDGDSKADLMATDHDGRAVVLLGNGKGGFFLEESPEVNQPRGRCRGYSVRIADVGLDGGPEVIASYAGESNPLYDPERCPSRGGVMAWTLEAKK